MKQLYAMLGNDYVSQEGVIAASLSKDKNMKDALADSYSGVCDFYLKPFIMLGQVPEGATKKSHPKERQTGKAVILGLGYCMGLDSLALQVQAGDPSLSLGEATEKAEEVMIWHKEHFYEFWDWVERSVDDFRGRQYHISCDGYITFLSKMNSRQTQLTNHPVQTTAAAMIRRATIYAVHKGLDVICSHHDAIYTLSKNEEAEQDSITLDQCMKYAAVDTIGDWCPMHTDSKIQRPGEFYKDDRGEEQLEVISKLFGWES